LEHSIAIPGSGQAPMARIVGAFPELTHWLNPIITRIGKHNQARMRKKSR
jgi:hypothetical protein